MKNILVMETGSFKVTGGAAKDTYKIYQRLKQKKGFRVDLYGNFSKVDNSATPIDFEQLMSRTYDFVLMNSIRDINVAELYRKAHHGIKTKFIYVDRGNVLLNSASAGLKMLLPKMIARTLLSRRMKSWLDCYVAISADQYEYAQKFFTGKTTVKYIVISPHEEYVYLGKKRSYNGALSVSRLDERQKKISFMIKGIKKIITDHPNLADRELLKIVGTGVDEENYIKMVENLGIERNVSFKGFLMGDRLVAAYNDAAFFVSTSEWEGLGRSLLEAMACGLPLLINQRINTKLENKPLTTIVKEGYNGFVYEYGNEEDFAEKFYKIYSNKNLQRRLSTNSRIFMKRFSFDKVVSEYFKILSTL